VTGEPSSSIICHCRTCRKASAAASVGWLTFDREKFAPLHGVPRSFASSSGVVRSFCPECGTSLTYANDASPSEIDVTTISLDDESIFTPTREVWLSHKVSWTSTDPTLTKYPKGTSDEVNSQS
jgi:hypothetical protein